MMEEKNGRVRRSTQADVVFYLVCVFLASIGVVACSQETQVGETEKSLAPMAYSLGGKPLFTPPESEQAHILKDSLLDIAKANYFRDSSALNNIIWYGRRLAYLSNYPEAIAVYTRGLRVYPDSPELLRHRGHRYITTRQFDNAITDLEHAADLVKGKPIEIEQDGFPNSVNTPLSTLQFNIWYHLGLAYYFKGNYSRATEVFDTCMRYSTNPDLLCATTDWYYMTLVRSGKQIEATALLDPITPDLKVIENQGYFQRLMMYKGIIAPEMLMGFDDVTKENELTVVTQGYGVAFYLRMRGNKEKSQKILEQIIKTSYWPAFGYIAAEADLNRK